MITSDLPIVKVVGVGGCGCNVLRAIEKSATYNPHFIAANTDWVALEKFEKDCGDKNYSMLKLGKAGLGCGANPVYGHLSAQESYHEIRAALSGASMVAILAGMGGGTGTGAAPVVASIARSLHIPVVAIVSTPFSFEGKQRADAARKGIAALRGIVDALTLIPNQALFCSLPKSMTMMDLFGLANNVAQCALWDFTCAYLVE